MNTYPAGSAASGQSPGELVRTWSSEGVKCTNLNTLELVTGSSVEPFFFLFELSNIFMEIDELDVLNILLTGFSRRINNKQEHISALNQNFPMSFIFHFQ